MNVGHFAFSMMCEIRDRHCVSVLSDGIAGRQCGSAMCRPAGEWVGTCPRISDCVRARQSWLGISDSIGEITREITREP